MKGKSGGEVNSKHIKIGKIQQMPFQRQDQYIFARPSSTIPESWSPDRFTVAAIATI